MAERPAVTARVFSRAELAALFNGNPRAVAAFEALGKDVSGTLPDAALANSEAAEGAQETADQAVVAADAAQEDATQALADAAAAQHSADAAQADIYAHRVSAAAHGTSGNVVGTSDVQWLTNKTLGTGTKLASQTLGAGTGTPALGNAGPAGDPATWLTININGTDYLMPLWLP
jgi:hypothetical protein